MPKKIVKGFTIIELLVVLAVIGVFVSFAYPNISNWIKDREVKKEAYEVITYLKERRNEVQSGQYGMIQVVMNWTIYTLKMTNEDFIKEYKDISSSSSYKTSMTCGFKKQNRLKGDSSLDLKFGSGNPNSNVNVYPSTSHPPPNDASVMCITKDGSIRYDNIRPKNVSETDPATGKEVDYFLLCSKTNSTMQSCKTRAKFDYMYKITWDSFINTKLYKYSEKYSKNNGWMKIDG